MFTWRRFGSCVFGAAFSAESVVQLLSITNSDVDNFDIYNGGPISRGSFSEACWLYVLGVASVLCFGYLLLLFGDVPVQEVCQ